MSEYIVCPYCHNPLSQSEYVKVARCRDCKWFNADVYVLPNDENWVYSCDLWGVMNHVPNPNGFCAWGIRKDVNNDN